MRRCPVGLDNAETTASRPVLGLMGELLAGEAGKNGGQPATFCCEAATFCREPATFGQESGTFVRVTPREARQIKGWRVP